MAFPSYLKPIGVLSLILIYYGCRSCVKLSDLDDRCVPSLVITELDDLTLHVCAAVGPYLGTELDDLILHVCVTVGPDLS